MLGNLRILASYLRVSSTGPCSRQQRWRMTTAQLHPGKKPKLSLRTSGLPTTTPAGAAVSSPSAGGPPASCQTSQLHRQSSPPRRRVGAASSSCRPVIQAAAEVETAEVDTVAAEPGTVDPESAPSPAAAEDAEAAEGTQPRPKKAIVMPLPIPPPVVPADAEPWLNGVLLVDKPKTWTSFDVCNKLKWAVKQFGVKKVGHAGTLDPMATGLLIVCVGRGTKAVDSFMAMQKEYSGTLRLGEGTPSYDADSEVNERLPWEHITDAEMLAARESFLGDIQQVPPMFSAIKVQGKRLYEVARKGGEVERQPRTITVDTLDLERDPSDPQSVHFRVVCSKGTYIRSLAADLGRKLGTAAHLTALRREAIGEYRVDDSWQIQDLAAQLVEKKSAAKAQEQPEAAVAAGAGPGVMRKGLP